jgi:hypothetical protein
MLPTGQDVTGTPSQVSAGTMADAEIAVGNRPRDPTNIRALTQQPHILVNHAAILYFIFGYTFPYC